MIYFLQVRGGGPIKIGAAIDVAARVKKLQCACPYDLELLGCIKGSRRQEKRLHRKFSFLRLRGEWFSPGPTLLRYITKKAVNLEQLPAAPESRKMTGHVNFFLSAEQDEVLNRCAAVAGVSVSQVLRDMVSFGCLLDKEPLARAWYETKVLGKPLTRKLVRSLNQDDNIDSKVLLVDVDQFAWDGERLCQR